MPQTSFFNNPVYFRLLFEFAEFELVKEYPELPGFNGFWGERPKRPFKSATWEKKNMNKAKKRSYLLGVVNQIKGNAKDLNKKADKKSIQTQTLRYCRKMEAKSILKDASTAQKYNTKNFQVDWEKLAKYFVEYVVNEYPNKSEESNPKDMLLGNEKKKVNGVKEEILLALKTILYYDHRLHVKTINGLFEYIFFLGVSECSRARIYDKKKQLICFPNPNNVAPHKMSPELHGNLSFTLFKIFLDNSLSKSKRYML